MRFLDALEFLTIARLPGRRPPSPEELGRSQVFFPVVGLLIGLSLAGLQRLFALGLPEAVASVLLVVWLTVVSGGLHLDGFADTCDGIGGQKPADARLAVMRDSRIGGFGAIGICLLLLVKYVSLNSLPGPAVLVTLITMPVISRWMMVYAITAYPYARPSGLGKAFKEAASWPTFLLTTLMTLVIVLGLLAWTKGTGSLLAGVVITGGTWIIIMAAASYLKRKFSGLTGDTYGFLNELAEVAVLVLVSLLAHNGWLGQV